MSVASPRRSHRFAFFSMVLVAAAAGCGGSSPPAGFDLPVALTVGGPVLKAPRVQPIYFSGFTYGADLDAFVTRLASSTYWPAVVTEYGVGPLVAAPGYATSVNVPATVTDETLPGLLAAALAEGAATVGAARADTVYAIFLGPGTKLSVMGQAFCGTGQPSAYHDELVVDGTHVAATVIPSCPTFPDGLMGADALTTALSHELVESVTDPFPTTQAAYTAIDREHVLWAVALNGAEVADLCENETPLTVMPADIGYPVARIWSNDSARTDDGPCVPVPPGEPFFQAVADQPEHAEYTTPSNATVSVPVMNAGVGQAALAHVSFRGNSHTTGTLSAVAFELDDAMSLGLERPTKAIGMRGQSVNTAIAASKAVSGVVPIIVGASDTTGKIIHLWVGGVNRK